MRVEYGMTTDGEVYCHVWEDGKLRMAITYPSWENFRVPQDVREYLGLPGEY